MFDIVGIEVCCECAVIYMLLLFFVVVFGGEEINFIIKMASVFKLPDINVNVCVCRGGGGGETK